MKRLGSLMLPTPRVPRTATALRFFEAITVPTPERPAARCRSLIDRGIETARLGGAAHGGDAQQRILVAVVQPLVRVPHRRAPDLVGGQQLGLVVLHVEVDGRGGLALEDDHVPAGVLHLGADEAAGVGAGDAAGQRALGDHRVAPAGGGHGPGQGAGGHDQLVVGPQGIAGGVDLLDQIFGRQPALAEVLARPLHVEGFGRDGAVGEIDAQNLSGPSHFLYLLRRSPAAPARLLAAQACILS